MPIDKAIVRMVSESSGRNKSKCDVASKGSEPEAELTPKPLERPSSSRREICGAGSRITGITGKSVEDERESEGSIGAMKQSNVCRAKGPRWLQRL